MARNSRVFDAPVERQGPVPAFRVAEYEGKMTRQLCEFDEKTRTIVKKEVEIEGGYMVFFPKGHSAYYHSLEALEDAGLGSVVPMITMSGSAEAEVNKEHDDVQPVTQRVIEKRR